MGDLNIAYKGSDGPAPRGFAYVNRYHSDLDWEESVQYDRFGRGKVLEHVRATASGRLVSEVPRAGFLGPSGQPCGEHRAGARPVWIWWVAVE